MVIGLEKSIIEVLTFFDMFDYPLTLLELKKWISIECRLGEIHAILDILIKKENIGSNNGYYFLFGRKKIVGKRLGRYKLAHHKYKKAVMMAKILRFFPWVRAMAVYSSLSFYNSARKGDIDFFIVAQSGRLWSARFFINFFLKVFNLRPNAKVSRDKICISFLVSENALDLSSVLNQPHDSLYTFGTGQFIFLYAENDLAKKFFKANVWIKEKKPNWFAYQVNHKRQIRKKKIFVDLVWQDFASWLPESFYHWLQMKILPDKLKQMMNRGTIVIINNQMIKLHDNDNREEFEIEYQSRLKKIF